MNKKIFSILIAMAMVVVGLSLTSCGDDDEDVVKPSNKATEAYLTPTVYISEAMMDYFDATCTIDGQTVTLTRDNTEADNMTVEGILFNIRKYKGATKTYKGFPSSLVVVQNVKPKAGVVLKDISRLDQFVMYTHVNFANNNTTNYVDGEWNTITGKLASTFQSGVHFNEMDDDDLSHYNQPTLTTTINMSAADVADIKSGFSNGQ